MSKIKVIEVEICEDCLNFLEDNLDGLSLFYDTDESFKEVTERIRAGVNLLTAQNIVYTSIDPDKTEEFSTQPCKLCSSKLHGKRFTGVFYQRNTIPISEVVTGVIGGNSLNWEYLPYDSIDPNYDSMVNELRLEIESEVTEDETIDPEDREDEIEGRLQEKLDCLETSDTQLIGSWAKDKDGLYIPDKKGKYAAIYDSNDNTMQIVWSKHAILCNKCSPCFPGQGDIDATGSDYYSFCLPIDCFTKRNSNPVLEVTEDE